MNEKEYFLLIDKYRNKLIDRDTFDKGIEEVTSLMESPQKEFYRIFCYLQTKFYVPKDKRSYLISNIESILNSSLINETEKEIIRCAAMNAYCNNYDYDNAEEYANTILDSNNLEILFELANYYVKTRRYDIADSIYKKLLPTEQEYIINSYNDFQKIINGTKKQYLPVGYENQVNYAEFLQKINIDFDIRQIRTPQPPKIPIEEYPTPKELTDSGFKNFVAFDIETTGLNPVRDSITEIGAIKVIDGKIVESKEFIFQELVHPYKRKIPPDVEELTGITNEMVYGAGDIWDVFPKFVEFIGDNILVGYNCIAFDSKFILRAGRLSNIIINNPYFDVMHYAKKFKLRINCENNKLNTIANQLGIVNEEAHRALSDAITTAKVYLKLLEIEKSKE